MAGRGDARVVVANRAQLSWDLINPDGWLAPDHRARLVVGFVETLDLTMFYDKIEAREGTVGRPAADPAVLFALWLLATMNGVGLARELDRLTSQDPAYRWVACGVPVNYHGLADFRVAHASVLDVLLTKSLAAFMAEGLFDADEIVVDGTKMKASAGKSSYKRALRLDEAEAEVKVRVGALKAEVEADPAASTKRTRRGAGPWPAPDAGADRKGPRQTGRDRSGKGQARRAQPERGWRAKRSTGLAHRFRGAADAVRGWRGARELECADCSDDGSRLRHRDQGDGPAQRQWSGATDGRRERATARAADQRVLGDTRFAQVEDITTLSSRPEAPVGVYIHPPRDRADVKPATPLVRQKEREREPQTIKDWRQRMITNEAETLMKKRGRIERVNANFKNRGFGTLLVRGLAKVQAIALWHALAHNLTIAVRLRQLLLPKHETDRPTNITRRRRRRLQISSQARTPGRHTPIPARSAPRGRTPPRADERRRRRCLRFAQRQDRAPRGGDGAAAQRIRGQLAGRTPPSGSPSARISSARYSSRRISASSDGSPSISSSAARKATARARPTSRHRIVVLQLQRQDQRPQRQSLDHQRSQHHGKRRQQDQVAIRKTLRQRKRGGQRDDAAHAAP